MSYFDRYCSNSVAGSGNHLFFCNPDEASTQKGRVFYKIHTGGTYNYSFLFSNMIDSTYDDGSLSHCNLVLDSWKIVQARVGIVKYCDSKQMYEPEHMYSLSFDERPDKTVNPGEIFHSDPIRLSADSGDYICLEVSFSGKQIPHHEQSLLPCFRWNGDNWVPSKHVVFAGMIGCDRQVEKRISFLGDSITQGCGTPDNSYTHWNAVVADILPKKYAYWNLGLGFGQAHDAATDGVWLFKAKHSDICVVCFGVNDIFRGYPASEIKLSLSRIVEILKTNGVQVVILTVPPFDFQADCLAKWNEINSFIRNELSTRAALFFDCALYLQKSAEEPNVARYGGHPNSEGCKILGRNLADAMKQWLDTLT